MEKDKLTGLLLFDSFLSYAAKYLAECDENDNVIVVSTDLSKFKYINRIYGFPRGNCWPK